MEMGAGASVSNRPWYEHHFAFSGSPQPRHRNWNENCKNLSSRRKTASQAAAKQLHLSGNSKWISPGRKKRTEPNWIEELAAKRRQRSEPKIDTNQLTFVPFISGLWSLNLSHVWLRLPVRSVRLEPRFALYNYSGFPGSWALGVPFGFPCPLQDCCAGQLPPKTDLLARTNPFIYAHNS